MRSGILCIVLFLLSGCQKEMITFSGRVSEVFYVENAGASMRVLVEGNTLSNIYVLVIHGGPGEGSYIYNTDYIRKNLEDKITMVYWDQRNAGGSQGNSNDENFTLNQMVEDLKKVIITLKSRYGQDISLFLLGHSFGGLIAADFVTRPDYQNMIKGLIDMDASHNYPLNDTLTRQMLLSEGLSRISTGSRKKEWQEIVSYCYKHTGNFTLDESLQMEKYAEKAETYIDSVNKINVPFLIIRRAISDRYPLTSILFNFLYSQNSDLVQEVASANFSGSLGAVTTPVLILWGKYDFVCPSALGVDFYNRIGSTEKKMVISPVSGHNMMLQDEKLFCDEINAFVLKYR